MEALSKLTFGILSNTNKENLQKGSSVVPLNTNTVAEHRLQMRIISDIFTFQPERVCFYGVDPTCMLCGDAEEDATHCLSDCMALSNIRDTHRKKISYLFPHKNSFFKTKKTFHSKH